MLKNRNADVVETRLHKILSASLFVLLLFVTPYFLGFRTGLNFTWGLVVALCTLMFDLVLWAFIHLFHVFLWTEVIALWLAKLFANRTKKIDWWFDLTNPWFPKQVLLYHNIKLGKAKLVEITHCDKKLISELWLYGSSFVAKEKYCHPLPLWLSWLLRS